MGRLTRSVRDGEEIQVVLKKLRKKFPNAQALEIEKEEIREFTPYEIFLELGKVYTGAGVVCLFLIPFGPIVVPIMGLLGGATTGGFMGIFCSGIAAKEEKFAIRAMLQRRGIKGEPIMLKFKFKKMKITNLWVFYNPVAK